MQTANRDSHQLPTGSIQSGRSGRRGLTSQSLGRKGSDGLGSCGERTSAALFAPFTCSDIFKDVTTWKQGQQHFRLRYWRHDKLTLGKDVWTIRDRRADDNDPPREVAAFEIDFAHSNKTLTMLFDNWLRSRREEKGYRERQTRGPASQTDHMRKKLLALGAWRLIHSGMTYKEAIHTPKR